MNNASEHDIDRVLTALRDTEPTAGLESRILQAVENRTPARSAWFRWTPSTQWGIAALATAAVILAVALTTHNTQQPTTTIAQTSGPQNAPTQTWGDPSSPTQTWGDPSSPEASSPAKVGPHNAPTPNLSSRPEAAYFAAAAERPAVGTTNTPTPVPRRSNSAHTPTYPPHQLLCDCDPVALAETQAPSRPAPEMPMTAQERLLQRVVRHDDPIEIAELEPLPKNPLRSAATTNEDDAVKNVVQHFLKQLAAAEVLNPTPPTPDPDTPATHVDSFKDSN
jgi:hypothetical protein